MMSFCPKNSEKVKLLGEEKNLKVWNWNYLNDVLQSYPTGDQKKCCIYFWKLDVKMKKKKTTLNNSKNFTIIFDHQFDINEKQNWETFETILGFQISFPHPARSFFFFYFLTQWCHQTFIYFALCLSVSLCVSLSVSVSLCLSLYLSIYIYSLACNNSNTYLKIIKMKQTILILKMMHSHLFKWNKKFSEIFQTVWKELSNYFNANLYILIT